MFNFDKYYFKQGTRIKMDIEKENFELWELYGNDWNDITYSPITWPYANASYNEPWPNRELWEALQSNSDWLAAYEAASE